MSSRAVRKTFRDWFADPTVDAIATYYDTINYEQNPIDDVWFTAEFSSFSRGPIGFCADRILEEGSAELVFFGRPGIGDDELLVAVEAVMAALELLTDPSQALVINYTSAPDEYTGGDVDREYGLSVFMDYSYFYSKPRAPVLGNVDMINVAELPVLGPVEMINVQGAGTAPVLGPTTFTNVQ